MGVIQGSKVGHLCFDIYSNDFSSICDGDKHIPYADDTCSVCIGDSLDSLVEQKHELANILDWCNDYKLSLKRTKCEFMLVTSKKISVPPDLLIGNNSIKRLNHFKYLGVLLWTVRLYSVQYCHVLYKVQC